MIKQYLETGKIVGTHGIKGMVRVQPWCDSGDFLCGFKYFYLDNKGAERLIYINRNDANLPSGRYFIEDLIGCAVFNADSGENYGVISEVSATGANDVWHISGGGREYLLPAIDEVVINADIENEKVFIRPMKGIFDDED